MPPSGSRTTVEDYLFTHPHLDFSAEECRGLEECSVRLYSLAERLLFRVRPGLPEPLRDSLVIQFTNQEAAQAKAGGFAPDLNIISISTGLIHRILTTSQQLSLEDSTKEGVENSMLMLVLGHELTHVMFGHNEIDDDDEPMEASAMEVHSDFFSGLYLAQLTLRDVNDDIQEASGALVAILACAALFFSLGGERTETYHSAPVRLMVVLAGYLRWAMDNSPAAAYQMHGTLHRPLLDTYIRDAVNNPDLARGMCSLLSSAVSAEEGLSDTIKAAEKFRSKWQQRSSLLEPIRDQLD